MIYRVVDHCSVKGVEALVAGRLIVTDQCDETVEVDQLLNCRCVTAFVECDRFRCEDAGVTRMLHQEIFTGGNGSVRLLALN